MDRALDRRIDGPNAEKRKKNRDKMKYKKRKKNG
jgi:hypothetical protein